MTLIKIYIQLITIPVLYGNKILHFQIISDYYFSILDIILIILYISILRDLNATVRVTFL